MCILLMLSFFILTLVEVVFFLSKDLKKKRAFVSFGNFTYVFVFISQNEKNSQYVFKMSSCNY